MRSIVRVMTIILTVRETAPVSTVVAQLIELECFFLYHNSDSNSSGVSIVKATAGRGHLVLNDTTREYIRTSSS